MSWVALSVLAMFSFVWVALIIKRLTLIEPQAEIINFYFFLLTTAVFLGLLLFKGTRLVISSGSIKWFVLLAVAGAEANYFSVTAIRSAPNPGYVTGIRGFEAGITAVVAATLFKSEITGTKFIWHHAYNRRIDLLESGKDLKSSKENCAGRRKSQFYRHVWKLSSR
jgi:hypothetical protein